MRIRDGNRDRRGVLGPGVGLWGVWGVRIRDQNGDRRGGQGMGEVSRDQGRACGGPESED